ncbi:response regulator [Granulicella aggregans]|jgi:hypothetical protein|uniref:response regulator n=1 Tax=Granulicella aggregans TaxID=474949 RepID=UPI0021E07B32|nr:response regulator [Granulicella aggregans]
MTSDQNVSDVQMHSDQPPPIAHQGDSGQDAGQNVPHGMGQSKSSRRRRRKRKGKGPEDVALNGAAQGGDSSGEAAAAPQSATPQGQPSRQQNAQAPNQQNGQQNATGTKRWKKKFRDRDRPREGRSENPGNQASGSSNGHSNSGGGSRSSNGDTHQFGNNAFKSRKGGGGGGSKQQSRGARGFVGPMDHSYRAVNGNFADTPPSTIESYGNHQPRGNGHSRGGGGGYHGDSQPIDYSQGRTIPIPEDAQTKIFFFIDDLFFVAKIQETARKLGVKIEFVKNDKESLAKLTGVEEADRPALIVFDLNNASAKPMTLIPKLKTKFKKSTSIVGFLSHLQGDLKAKAVEAGCDSVMPRAAFSQNLPNLLRRYGIVEEEEPNYNM